jgi:hypothetical protein
LGAVRWQAQAGLRSHHRTSVPTGSSFASVKVRVPPTQRPTQPRSARKASCERQFAFRMRRAPPAEAPVPTIPAGLVCRVQLAYPGCTVPASRASGAQATTQSASGPDLSAASVRLLRPRLRCTSWPICSCAPVYETHSVTGAPHAGVGICALLAQMHPPLQGAVSLCLRGRAPDRSQHRERCESEEHSVVDRAVQGVVTHLPRSLQSATARSWILQT